MWEFRRKKQAGTARERRPPWASYLGLLLSKFELCMTIQKTLESDELPCSEETLCPGQTCRTVTRNIYKCARVGVCTCTRICLRNATVSVCRENPAKEPQHSTWRQEHLLSVGTSKPNNRTPEELSFLPIQIHSSLF